MSVSDPWLVDLSAWVDWVDLSHCTGAELEPHREWAIYNSFFVHPFPASHSQTLCQEKAALSPCKSSRAKYCWQYVWIHGSGKWHLIEVFPRSTGVLHHCWYLASGTRGCIKLHWRQRRTNLSRSDNEVSRWAAVDARVPTACLSFLLWFNPKVAGPSSSNFYLILGIVDRVFSLIVGKLYQKGTSYNKLDSLDSWYLCLTTHSKTFLSPTVTEGNLTFTSSPAHILGWAF